MLNAKEVLKVYFGYDSFRDGQEKIIDSIVSGRDALAIMPTGAGKSICYQVPALMLSGITIVISPLISLMQDQVKSLNEAGIHAAYINSSLTEVQVKKALSMASEGVYKIIYVAPERLMSYEFMNFANRADISMITVDEAHCISQWGQDFRPSYLKIVEFINNLPKRPIVSAFTATATEEVKNDILCILGLMDPKVTVTGFDRENLYYRVESIKKKEEFVIDYIDTHPKESGIIYCATRKNVDNLFEVLFRKGISVTRYHAGMDNETRKKNQDDFIYDRASVMVATNAFGMGIDKSNVRYVIHYNMPQSMENYYQEAGRAGRDGEMSQCILLFSAQDVVINKFLLENKEFSGLDYEDVELVKQQDIRRLMVMEGYCRTTGCLRNYILEYFGEKIAKPCDNCSNCHREYKEVDMTSEAKWVINCVAETKGRYGIAIVVGTLMGANRARLRELGTVNYKSYGVLKDSSESIIRTLINQLIECGYLYQTEDTYSVLKMGDISPLKDANTHVIIRTYEEKVPDRKEKGLRKRSTDVLTSAGYDLFEELRKLRMEIAREEALPPYIIFNDKTLIDMCVKLPETSESLLKVSGVGQNKLEKYGDRFLSMIKAFLDAHPDAILSMNDEDSNDEMADDKVSGIANLSKEKKKGKRKPEFYLADEDVDKFVYKDLYYISEIKDELNRICTVSGVKKVTTGVLLGFLLSEGLICENEQGGGFTKLPTEKGLEYGIIIEEKVGYSGIPYKLIKYPPEVQKMVVEHLVGARCEENEKYYDEKSAEINKEISTKNSTTPLNYLNLINAIFPGVIPENKIEQISKQYTNNGNELKKQFDRAEFNRQRNRPDGAGASWDEEEDARLDREYESGMSISEMAKLHSRTPGGIQARLKKHGWIE